MTLDPAIVVVAVVALVAVVVVWRIVPGRHRDKVLAAVAVGVAVLAALLAGARREQLDDGSPPAPTEPDTTPSPGARVLREHVGAETRAEVEAIQAAADDDLDTLADLANARDARARRRQ